MERLQTAAVILSLVERLRKEGSWNGETHIQKATYFLQELMDVPLGFEFVLYRYGPFSFDLRDELVALRADGLLAIKPQSYPYGPSIVLGEESKQVTRRYAKTIDEYQPQVDFVAARLGHLDVANLERVTTALYVTRALGDTCSVDVRAQRLNDLKPHVTIEQAREAVRQVDTFIADVLQQRIGAS